MLLIDRRAHLSKCPAAIFLPVFNGAAVYHNTPVKTPFERTHNVRLFVVVFGCARQNDYLYALFSGSMAFTRDLESRTMAGSSPVMVVSAARRRYHASCGVSHSSSPV